MHDWTLLSIVVNWAARSVHFHFRTLESEEAQLVVQGFTDLRVPRRQDWGPSVSINSFTGPSFLADGNQQLTIEMQTGDTILVEGVMIVLPGNKMMATK